MELANRESTMRMLNKVPEVTMVFWIVKIMATTVGETAADFLNTGLHLGLGGTSLVMGTLLMAALVGQIRARQYVPWIYWIAVILVSVAGTLVTDNITDHFGIPLQWTTATFAAALAISFAIWYRSERTLSINTIVTPRRELHYWAAILLTFALGTAAGDLLAEALKLGYLFSAMVFGAGIALVAVAHYAFKLNAILSFWIAYILTRPFGASFGDLLSQPADSGGLGLGTVGTSVIFLTVILGLVAYMPLAGRAATRRAPRDIAA